MGFVEETKGPSRNVAIAIIIASIFTGIAITIIASMVGAPNIQEYLSAPSPF
ncbi:hypothetical protein ACFY5J_23790 [Peribacillus butanolivorans]|uniref:hypothetical protein n=1 Tax=Peribacillus butanolivorans TaxID=421767 RepID=UPI00366DFBF1